MEFSAGQKGKASAGMASPSSINAATAVGKLFPLLASRTAKSQKTIENRRHGAMNDLPLVCGATAQELQDAQEPLQAAESALTSAPLTAYDQNGN